jgi:hypothetical protein
LDQERCRQQQAEKDDRSCHGRGIVNQISFC